MTPSVNFCQMGLSWQISSQSNWKFTQNISGCFCLPHVQTVLNYSWFTDLIVIELLHSPLWLFMEIMARLSTKLSLSMAALFMTVFEHFFLICHKTLYGQRHKWFHRVTICENMPLLILNPKPYWVGTLLYFAYFDYVAGHWSWLPI